jgi:hypothetical protein
MYLIQVSARLTDTDFLLLGDHIGIIEGVVEGVWNGCIGGSVEWTQNKNGFF